MSERILASPRYKRHPDCQPLADGPLCPLCFTEVDVVGEGETGAGLLCPCGYAFIFNPPAAHEYAQAGASPLPGFGGPAPSTGGVS